jgi:hypothetical protein
MKKIFILFFLTVFLTISQSVKAETYEKYCNSRYGFCVDYPTTLSLEPPPANGDGRIFFDSHGFKMTASGINNLTNDTITSEMESASENIDQITYKAQGKNWFVISGYQGSKIIYIKTYVGTGSINHLWIEYPKTKNQYYSELVTRISNSFNPGNLTISH